jgi:hypothetical protein
VFVLTVDQRNSRRAGDRVPEALSALPGRADGVTLAFARTAGDEFQGVLDRAGAVVDAVTTLTRLGGWSVGVGVGRVEQPLPESTREGRGDAFIAARHAVEAARRRREPRLCVRGADPAAAAAAEAALRLLLVVLSGRSAAAWQAADLVRDGTTHAEAARRLGISRQAVGQRLAAGHVEVERAAAPVVADLLRRADG